MVPRKYSGTEKDKKKKHEAAMLKDKFENEAHINLAMRCHVFLVQKKKKNKFKTFQLLEAEIELLVKFDFFFGKLFLRLQTTERNAFNLIPSDKRPIQAENLLLWNKTVIVIGKENETR